MSKNYSGIYATYEDDKELGCVLRDCDWKHLHIFDKEGNVISEVKYGRNIIKINNEFYFIADEVYNKNCAVGYLYTKDWDLCIDEEVKICSKDVRYDSSFLSINKKEKGGCISVHNESKSYRVYPNGNIEVS